MRQRRRGRPVGSTNRVTRGLVDKVSAALAEAPDRELDEALALVAEQKETDLAVRLAAVRALAGSLFGKFHMKRLEEKLSDGV